MTGPLGEIVKQLRDGVVTVDLCAIGFEPRLSNEALREIESYRQRELDVIRTAHLYWFR